MPRLFGNRLPAGEYPLIHPTRNKGQDSRVGSERRPLARISRMFGIPDYFIRVRVTDSEHYERWLTTDIMGDVAIARIDSRLTMKLLKN